jgi:hypothetical protein
MASLGFLMSASLSIDFHVSLEVFHLSFAIINELLFKLWLVRWLRLIIDLLLQLALRL